MSRHHHGSPEPSPAFPLYRPSLPVGFQSYVLSRYRVVVCGSLCSSMLRCPQEYVT